MDEKIGGYAFIGGTIIAILMGLLIGIMGESVASQSPWSFLPLVLVVLGLLVGFLNVGDKEITPFLIAAIALMSTENAAATLKLIPIAGVILYYSIHYLVAFAAPAALIVALLEFSKLASKK
ncbi:MAG: hypothetical protein QXK06_00200 [Candidatus Diapherotrites archaeon]